MRRIRIVFLLLGVVLLVPLVLLVQRALEGEAREREVSHRAVAERLFDEMERELSSLLRAEEERPFDDYRAAGKAKASGRRSDASAPRSAEPFVVGYFQIDPDGKFNAPSRTAAMNARESAHKKPAAEAKSESVREFEALVERGLEEQGSEQGTGEVAESKLVVGGSLRGNAVGDDEFDAQADKPSRSFQKEAVAGAEAAPEQEIQARKQVSPYEALQSLNKGALARSERQIKHAVPDPVARERRDADARMLRGVASEASPDSNRAPLAPKVELLDQAASVDALTSTLPKDSKADGDVLGNEIFSVIASEEASVEVYPMTGRLVDGVRLLLDRQVFIAGERYRQGLVVDVPALFRHLDQAVLGGSELAAFVARSFYTADPEPTAVSANAEYRFRHRFAEPFDALGVRLELTPLPDVGGGGYLTAIAVLLLLSGTGGLFALYRMVAVTVRFAERRNNFVAAVSHELKTPLTAIRMYGEMLRDGMVEDSDKRQEYYGTITAESERLTRLINNVLEFSRLEQGTREANLVVGSIGPVVREAAAILEPHARELGFRVEVSIADGLPPVRFERDAVLQVVFNLVDNALKYARDAGDRVIAIRCAAEGDGVSVAVRDRGPGVPASHLSKIFEPFYRCEDELTRTSKGTGIGLALVRGLAETMGAAVIGRNLDEGGFEVSLRFRSANG